MFFKNLKVNTYLNKYLNVMILVVAKKSALVGTIGGHDN